MCPPTGSPLKSKLMSMYLPKRLELWLRLVRALPKASSTQVDLRSTSFTLWTEGLGAQCKHPRLENNHSISGWAKKLSWLGGTEWSTVVSFPGTEAWEYPACWCHMHCVCGPGQVLNKCYVHIPHAPPVCSTSFSTDSSDSYMLVD